MDDVFVYAVSLPAGCNEAVLPCADGYTVYINEKLDDTHRMNALQHALKHIANKDFEKDNVQQIEADAHRKDD